MNPSKGYGGKTVYGARVGILMLDTKWPRPPGDTGTNNHDLRLVIYSFQKVICRR